MDQPSQWLGSNHRIVRHDPLTVAYLWKTKGQKAALHAVSHILVDKTLTKSYNQVKRQINKMIRDAFGNLLNI